jgi:hypothetical protein
MFKPWCSFLQRTFSSPLLTPRICHLLRFRAFRVSSSTIRVSAPPTFSSAPFGKLRAGLISRYALLPTQPLIEAVQEEAEALVVVRVQFQPL